MPCSRSAACSALCMPREQAVHLTEFVRVFANERCIAAEGVIPGRKHYLGGSEADAIKTSGLRVILRRWKMRQGRF